MTEAASDHTDSRHSLDELFQLLIHARGVLPDTKAKGEILSALQRGDLQVDFHICGGARSVRHIREPTLEELREFEALSQALRKRKASEKEMREAMDRANAFLYEHAPPEGITGRVHRESWEPGRVFYLTIKDGALSVLPNCALDYPWDAYSFTIANWWLVDELWPPRSSQPSLGPNSQASSRSTTKPPRPGSADALIDVVAANGAWRNLTGKGLHSLAAQHIDNLNVENERNAKKQSLKPPPKINCPGVRAFQTAVAKRRRRERQGQAQ